MYKEDFMWKIPLPCYSSAMFNEAALLFSPSGRVIVLFYPYIYKWIKCFGPPICRGYQEDEDPMIPLSDGLHIDGLT